MSGPLDLRSIQDRLYNGSHYDDKTGCILWDMYTTPAGYGRIQVSGRSERAHRVAWTVTCGPIPKDVCVLHVCDIPRCINVHHLFLGSQRDNMRDCSTKGRMVTFPCGENHPLAKLKIRDIPVIRKRIAKGDLHREIAADYGVHRTKISAIHSKQTWRHVQ